jgi:CTP synthase (UTP-ammonia lyase)
MVIWSLISRSVYQLVYIIPISIEGVKKGNTGNGRVIIDSNGQRFSAAKRFAHIGTQKYLTLGQGDYTMNQPLHIGIIGDFNPQSRYHLATNEALRQAGRTLSAEVTCDWLPTPALMEAGAEAALERCDALWCSPDSPYESMDGALRGIQFARERGRPFVGT